MCDTAGSAVDTKEAFFLPLEKKSFQFICIP